MLACTSLRNGGRLVAMSNRGSKWLVFTCVAIAQFMVILDVTITNVALPVIKVQLHFGNAAIGWVVTAYVLTFGGFLLFGGARPICSGGAGCCWSAWWRSPSARSSSRSAQTRRCWSCCAARRASPPP
jgi:hypothetical protein